MDEHASTEQPSSDAPLDPRTSDPREVMRALLPPARAEYIKAWELLADASTPLERRRAARERAKAIGDDHALVASALRAREASLSGDDLLNARHLADELERHVTALVELAGLSPIGVQSAAKLRPESLGCGRRYRDPGKVSETDAATRAAASTPKRGDRGRSARAAQGDRDRPRPGDFRDKGPKVPRDALGTTKHDSALGDDLDPETRAKLEAMRAALED